ncbi:MAG TPA: elongation factor G [Myxococcales bacterium]|nr:elongation factor G [Myxococcales bacterium]
MKRIETPFIRNIAFVGHGGTGKTSLGEAILFTCGATSRLGSVNEKTSAFDFEPEEIARQTSYASAVVSVEWNQHKINLLDTPGDGVFQADTRLCMAAADLTLLLVSAVDQVEVGSARAWASAEELGRPRMIYVAKMDKDRANFDKTLAEMRSVWGPDIAPLQIPIGAGDDFKGVVDVLNMKAYTYSGGTGIGTLIDVPGDLEAAAADAREALIEAIATSDDDLMEKYLDTGELSESEVKNGLKAAIAAGSLVPVLCGCATDNAATDVLLNAIVDVAPSPLDAPLPKALNADESEVVLKCDDNGAFAALVFKTIYLEMGKVCFVRVFQGKGDTDLTFYNATQETKERWGQVLLPFGKKLESLSSGTPCGDIFAVAKLKETRVGDVLCKDKMDFKVQTPPVPNACISFALKAKNKGEEDKIAGALSRVLESDISLTTSRDQQTKDHLISGMGQTHIEVAVSKMRRFGGEVELLPPRVAYRECIRSATKRVEGKHKKQSGGRGQYGVCILNIEPQPRGTGFEFVNSIFGGFIPIQFVLVVDKGVRDAMVYGPLAGYPVVDVKISCVDGKYHPVDSDGRSFEMAGRKGAREGMLACSPTLLEPIMTVAITVPDESMGDVMGDINSRRGRISGMASKAGNQIINAQVPQAEVLTYAPDLRSMTGGRGYFTMEFSHYEEVPGNLVDKIVAASKAESDSE